MLIKADARRIPLQGGIVNCVVTSPPYWGLRDYRGEAAQIGIEESPELYVLELVAVFREIGRVLRDDGVVWLNLGDSYARAGGEGTHGPNATVGNTINGVQRRNLVPPDGLKAKDLIGVPWRVALALQSDGWYLRADVIWSKPNPMPESVTDRPTKAHEYVFLLTKSERYYYDAAAIAETSSRDRSGNTQRTHGAERGWPGSDLGGSVPWSGDSRNSRSVWTDRADVVFGRALRDDAGRPRGEVHPVWIKRGGG